MEDCLGELIGFDKERNGSRERHPLNAPGPFYVVNDGCLTCGIAEDQAPHLIESCKAAHWHCYFKKQPETPEEIEQAINVLAVSDVAAHRYAGDNKDILRRLKVLGCEKQCDIRLTED